MLKFYLYREVRTAIHPFVKQNGSTPRETKTRNDSRCAKYRNFNLQEDCHCDLPKAVAKLSLVLVEMSHKQTQIYQLLAT
ncbi:hypothetical protein [Scytonema sp. NUACC21]